jgi:hypothetical protein
MLLIMEILDYLQVYQPHLLMEHLPRLIGNFNIANTISNNRHSDISLESMSKIWRIGLNTARDTLRITK